MPSIMPPMYSLHLSFFNCLTPMPPSLIGRLMRFCMKGDRVEKSIWKHLAVMLLISESI